MPSLLLRVVRRLGLSVARLIISTEPGIGFRCENEDKNVKILVIENALGYWRKLTNDVSF